MQPTVDWAAITRLITSTIFPTKFKSFSYSITFSFVNFFFGGVGGGGGWKNKQTNRTEQNRTGKQANQGHIINWKPSEKNVNGAFHLVSHMLNPFCNTTIWILCYENGEQENSDREQNLT